MIASLLAREIEDAITTRERDLRARGLTTREALGLDALPPAKRALVDTATERPSKRPRHDVNPWRFANADHVRRFPALQRRNHFVIQHHHATSNHYDLRLLCCEAHSAGPCEVCATTHQAGRDGRVEGTLSWAIPKGLGGLVQGKHILGVETQLHPVHYTLHQGSGIGTTLVYDLGTYEILSSATGRDKAADTDDEADGDGEIYGGTRGMRHEKALARAYRGRPHEPGVAFVIRLRGARFDIQLAMAHQRTDVKWAVDKWTGRRTKRKQWVIQLSMRDGHIVNEERPLGPRSILTGQTMDELKAEGDLLSGAGPSAVRFDADTLERALAHIGVRRLDDYLDADGRVDLVRLRAASAAHGGVAKALLDALASIGKAGGEDLADGDFA